MPKKKGFTSDNPGRQGGRLLSARNREIGIGSPYCKWIELMLILNESCIARNQRNQCSVKHQSIQVF